MHHFQFTALPIEPFKSFFTLTDRELAQRGARRYIADKKPGFPCRVSLKDAEPGERVVLLPFAHHDVASPYRSSGPIFVCEQAEQARLDVDAIPEVVRERLVSVRGYDTDGLMVAAEVIEGKELAQQIDRCFGDPKVLYLHIHNARPGCYSCRVDRASV